MRKLSELVSSALRSAEDGVKIASLQEAAVVDPSFDTVDHWLGTELGQVETEEAGKTASAQQPQPAPTPMDNNAYALKLAEALKRGASVVEKLAAEGGGLPHSPKGAQGSGPVPLYPDPPNREVITHPPTQASAFARSVQANKKLVNGRPETYNDGPPSNEGPVVPPGGFGGGGSKRLNAAKTAARSNTERIIATKMAQHAALVSLGRIDAANDALRQAHMLKRAADNMTNGSNGLIQGDNLSGTMFPDNAGVRNLTKAQARDATQRQAGNYFGEPVKRDNAVAATTLRTDGLKLSSAQARALVLRSAHEKQAGILDSVGKGVQSAGRYVTSRLGRVARSARDATKGPEVRSMIEGAPVEGPLRQGSLLNRTANSVRGGLHKAHKRLGAMTEGELKATGGAALGLGGAGAAYGGYRALRSD